MSARGDRARLLGQLERLGCEVRISGRSHYKVRTPNGATLTVSASGDRNMIRAFVRDLNKYGGIEATTNGVVGVRSAPQSPSGI